MAQCPFLGLHIYSELGGFRAVVELFLFHGELCIAQHVLLLGQFALGIEYFEVEVGVAQPYDNVALVHLRTFVNDLLNDHTALFGRDLHHLDGHHIAVKADVVVELRVGDCSDTQPSRVDLQR